MTVAARRIMLAGVAVALLASAGCATVQPWERGTLAKAHVVFAASGS